MEGIDRISQLPEAIAHHVLSFLKNYPKELVRMSVLSKDWFAITASFPILDFRLEIFTDGYSLYEHDIEDFLKYVEYTTSRFCNPLNNTSVHTFDIETEPLEPSQFSIVDTCIGLILRKGGLQVLRINMDTNYIPTNKYCVPDTVLSVSSLSSLIIHNCELPLSLMVDDDDDAMIKLKSLKLLHLESVDINEQVIKRLTTCCPLLEEFKLLDCSGFKRFCIYGCQNLEQVTLQYFEHDLERIDIDAPNLSSLYLIDWGSFSAPCMNLASCKKLTTVFYRGNVLPELLEGPADFLSNFPFVERLYLDTSDHGRLTHDRISLKLSSPSLRTLMLIPWCGLDVIDIDAPNLLLFKYSFECGLSELLLVRNSVKSETQMEWDPISAVCFKELRRFLNKTSGLFKVLKLNIYSPPSYLINVEELKLIDSPPCEVERVEVELEIIASELSAYVAVVDALLWCLHPRSLTLKSDFCYLDFEQRIRIIKYTYEKLLQQKGEGRSTDMKIMLSIISSSSSSKAEEHFINDLNSLLGALPRDDGLRHIITLTE